VDDPGASGDGQDGLISRSGTAMEPNALRDWSHVTYDWLYHSIEADLGYLDQFEKDEIYAATKIAFIAHDGQRRKSGEPFIMHPVAVAQILAQQKMDHETVVAGLLHDTVEDTDHVTFESIQERFGPAVRRIVEGETKVSKVSSSVSKKKDAGAVGGSVDGSADDTPPTTQNVQADDLREMFLAMTQEVRIAFPKSCRLFYLSAGDCLSIHRPIHY
jgi:(p)ppGpp synthase/HD superfamily hydrolase|tara:strand:- start:1021 stop:1668 length:648 start_codon:yes stop_codon:yes gene_type:complete